MNEAQIDGALSDFSVDYKAEMLDVTTFGDDTRIKKGGLFTASISGKGFFDQVGGVGNLDAFLFNNNGTDESTAASGNPTIVTVFANGITEGAVTDMGGFAMKGVLESMTMGGGVGIALPLSFAVSARGVFA